jgi:hypothetical protein
VEYLSFHCFDSSKKMIFTTTSVYKRMLQVCNFFYVSRHYLNSEKFPTSFYGWREYNFLVLVLFECRSIVALFRECLLIYLISYNFHSDV